MSRLQNQGWSLKLIKRLAFVINVGKISSGEVFLGSSSQSGNHWTLAVLDLSSAKLFYCDSLAWDIPKGLLEKLAEFSKYFGMMEISQSNVIQCHDPTSATVGSSHECSMHCRNYPLQKCSDVCGVVALINAAVLCAGSWEDFKFFIGPQTPTKSFLHDPTYYNIYLRRTLINWCIDQIELKFIRLETTLTKLMRSDHLYHRSPESKLQLKRKLPESTNSETKVNVSDNHATAESDCDQKMHTSNSKYDITETVMEDAGLVQKNSNDIKPDRSQQKDKKSYVCNICQLKMTTKQALFKHKKRKHSTSVTEKTLPVKCMQCEQFRCSSIKQLIVHLRMEHQMDVETLSIKFDKFSKLNK